MARQQVSSGQLCFLGPSHVPALEVFTYVTVDKIQGATATVRVVGPGAGDNAQEYDAKVAVLRHRVIDVMEADMWPGSFVGHPIAFVQTSGTHCDQWAYGLVTGYSMSGNTAHLHVRIGETTQKMTLSEPPSVITADRLNYALSTGLGVNVTVLNTDELLDRQNQVIVACGKSRSGIPASVTSSMLGVPYAPDELVPLIRPDTLQIVHVRRKLN